MDIGVKLRDARQARGMSIAALAGITRLPTPWLEAIERNDLSVFPAGPYARAHVRSYAREVGLNADDTAHDYFAQFQPAPDPVVVPAQAPRASVEMEPRPARSWAVTGAAVLCVALAVMFWPGKLADVSRTPEAGAVGTSGSAAAALPAVATAPAAPAIVPASGLAITLIADQPAWVAAHADGKRVLYRLMSPGDRETLRGDRLLTIRVGNAGAVRWTIGGREVGPMGAAGAVRTVAVTPDNAATVR
jgi:transcriptional regulator with XRE-family HTH domain